MKNDANVTAVNIVLVTIIVVLCAVIGFQYLKIKDLQTHIATITQQ